MGSKVLVTGGTGFIGRSLVEGLVQSGYRPVVFDNDSRGSAKTLAHLGNQIDFCEGDIREQRQVSEAAQGCDAIFHLAFVNGTRFFYEKPDLVLDVGVKGALTTLEAAKEQRVKKYILASSSEVYHLPNQIPTSETERLIIPDVTNPRFSYAGGKIISELLTLNYLRNTEISHTIFRPHNIFGPNMGFEHVIPELMKKIHQATNGYIEKGCDLVIQGTGDETRAFCYVEDAVKQVMTLLERGDSGEIYHVGMDREISIRRLVSDLGRLIGIKINISPGELRQGGTSRRCPDLSKIQALGYVKDDNYEKGLEATVEWYKDYYINNPVEE